MGFSGPGDIEKAVSPYIYSKDKPKVLEGLSVMNMSTFLDVHPSLIYKEGKLGEKTCGPADKTLPQ